VLEQAHVTRGRLSVNSRAFALEDYRKI